VSSGYQHYFDGFFSSWRAIPGFNKTISTVSRQKLAKLGGPHGNNEESAYKYKLHGELTGDDAHWWPPEDGGQRGCLPVLNTRMTAAHSETRLHELSRHTP
jgi:hypothetical protein